MKLSARNFLKQNQICLFGLNQLCKRFEPFL